jgi:hypothetical protein
MVRRRASLDANQAGRQLFEERQNLAAPQLSTHRFGVCRFYFFDAKAFAAPDYTAGWRWSFYMSLFLLIFSVYIRLKLNESPVFQKMKEEGRGARTIRRHFDPLTPHKRTYTSDRGKTMFVGRSDVGNGVTLCRSGLPHETTAIPQLAESLDDLDCLTGQSP